MLVLASTKFKLASMAHPWIEKAVLYTNMCQELRFDHYCSCCSIVFGGRQLIIHQKEGCIIVLYQLCAIIFRLFKSIAGCSSFVGVHKCFFKTIAIQNTCSKNGSIKGVKASHRDIVYLPTIA